MPICGISAQLVPVKIAPRRITGPAAAADPSGDQGREEDEADPQVAGAARGVVDGLLQGAQIARLDAHPRRPTSILCDELFARPMSVPQLSHVDSPRTTGIAPALSP